MHPALVVGRFSRKKERYIKLCQQKWKRNITLFDRNYEFQIKKLKKIYCYQSTFNFSETLCMVVEF